MRISIRLWAALAVIVGLVVLVQGGFGAAVAFPASNAVVTNLPVQGVVTPDDSQIAAGTLPEFPSNLTHFVYIIRENHAFDDYLGDCATTINDTCNDGADYTAGGYDGGASGSHVQDVPFLHYWGQQGTVFDNMYTSEDPYSAQAHSFLFSDDAKTSGGTDNCGDTTTEGAGAGTQWSDYNSSSNMAGSCSWSPDSGQEYPAGGTVFDRFTRTNVNQTSPAPEPFLVIGDVIWELSSPGCTVKSVGGIAGSLPGNSVAVEHTTCTGTQGWWKNTTSGTVNPVPPVTDPYTSIPEMLFDCQYECNTINPMSDQYAADAFISFVQDYGLPTYTWIELFDDHPGPSCPGSGVTYDQCIEWNDQSMNLITEDIYNATSPYKDNTVVAITEDETQDGQNGGDHVNNGRRIPFVLMAPPSVMKTGNPNPASCGLTSGKCGNIDHTTFNTSNVLAVMERIELNVNHNIWSTTAGGLSTFPMALNDQLASVDPLENVWRCADPSVPCNTGTFGSGVQVLTSVGVAPSPVTVQVSGTTGITATAMDQTGASIASATYAWSAPSIGTVSPATGATTTYTAPATAGNGHVCVNATYNSVTVMGCDIINVLASITLASVSVSPGPNPTAQVSTATTFTGAALSSASTYLYPPSATFAWTSSSSSAGSFTSPTSGTVTNFTTGSSAGSTTICLNVTYSGKTLNACSFLTISLAAPTQNSVTVSPTSATVGTGGSQLFTAAVYDQFGNPLSQSSMVYTWTLSPSSMGSLNVTSGTNYKSYTGFTAGTTTGTVTLGLTVTNVGQKVLTDSVTITISNTAPPLTASFTQSPWHGTAPLTVSVNGAVSGGSGSGYSQSMNWGDGTGVSAGSGATISMSHQYASAGEFTPSLTVTDSLGHTAQVSLGPVYVYSNSTNTQPLKVSASGTPLTGGAPLPVVLTGGISGGKAPYQASWNFGDGTTGVGSVLSHTYASVGSYYATFWVNDSAGATGSATLEVDALAPGSGSSFVISVIGGPTSGDAPLNVSFVGSGAGGTAPYSFSWNWGDGTSASTGSSVSHMYTAAGTYTVNVTATDSASHTATQTIQVVVAPPPPPSVQNTGGSGPLGIPWTEWGLLLVVVALVGVLAVVLISRRPKHPRSYDDGAMMAGAAAEPAAMGYAGSPIQPGPPTMAPPAPSSRYTPADDSQAPNPMGR